MFSGNEARPKLFRLRNGFFVLISISVNKLDVIRFFFLYQTRWKQTKSLNFHSKVFQYLKVYNKLQPWTKLVETKVENPVNSRNDSIFEIPNSPPYPPISMLTLAKFCCQKPKTLPTTLTWGERGFFTEK